MSSKVKVKLIYTCNFEVHNFKARNTQNEKYFKRSYVII